MTTTDVSQEPGALRSQLLDEIRTFLQREREVDPERVQEGAHFKDDLGLDSLDVAAIAVELEDKYEVELEDEHVVLVRTVGDALDVVIALMRGEPLPAAPEPAEAATPAAEA
ncbi:MAG TPA: acyl carrier protein [Thermoleophilaceae bacterium]